jgi:NAD-specific glutamate dehydrogenase
MAQGQQKNEECEKNRLNHILPMVNKMIMKQTNAGKTMTEIFNIICFKQNLDVAKCMYLNYSTMIDIHSDYDEIFVEACLNNHLEIAKWLFSLEPNGFNIHIDDNSIIGILCEMGIHLEMIQWLLTVNNSHSKRIDFSNIKMKKFQLRDLYTPNINPIHTEGNGGIPVPSV